MEPDADVVVGELGLPVDVVVVELSLEVEEEEMVPMVMVDKTSSLVVGLLLVLMDEGMGIGRMAVGLGLSNEPVILSSRKKGEKAA